MSTEKVLPGPHLPGHAAMRQAAEPVGPEKKSFVVPLAYAVPRPSRRPVPKLVDHEMRKLDVAEAAARVVAERGIENATIRAIAERAGLSTGALAHYFDGKDELMVHALRWATERMSDRLLERLAGLRTLDELSAAVRAVLPLEEQGAVVWRVQISFWAYGVGRPDLVSLHRREMGGWLARVVEAVGRIQRAGIVRSDLAAEHITAALISMVMGMGVQLLFDGGARDGVLAAVDAYNGGLAP